MDSRQISLNAFSHMGLQQLESVGRFDPCGPGMRVYWSPFVRNQDGQLTFFKVNFRDPEFKTFIRQYVTKLGGVSYPSYVCFCVVFCFSSCLS